MQKSALWRFIWLQAFFKNFHYYISNRDVYRAFRRAEQKGMFNLGTGKTELRAEVQNPNITDILIKEFKPHENVFQLTITDHYKIQKERDLVNKKYEKQLERSKETAGPGIGGEVFAVDGLIYIGTFVLTFFIQWITQHLAGEIDDKAWSLFKKSFINVFEKLKKQKTEGSIAIVTSYKPEQAPRPTIYFVLPTSISTEKELMEILETIRNFTYVINSIHQEFNGRISVYSICFDTEAKIWRLGTSGEWNPEESEIQENIEKVIHEKTNIQIIIRK
ncbi:MAG: hypothetical protein AAB439_00900 [Patescibacteria group bacterium]